MPPLAGAAARVEHVECLARGGRGIRDVLRPCRYRQRRRRHPGKFTMTDKFVSVGTLILVVNDEGEAVEGMCHLVADDDTGPNIMATTRQAQFAAT